MLLRATETKLNTQAGSEKPGCSVYEETSKDDGLRVLVDRLWPRGIKKEDAKLDDWCKDLAPSTEARKDFNHKPENFDEFEHVYTSELDDSDDAQERIKKLKEETHKNKPQTLTLLYAAKDEDCNHAMILRDYMQKKWK